MIDSHAHVIFDGFDNDREEVIARARVANVSWIEIGTDLEQSKECVELAARLRQGFGARSPLLGTTVGVHPSDVGAGIDWDEIKKLLRNPNVVAIGEVGLDLYHSQNLEEQLEALKKFVDLAREKDLPVVFHVRDPSASLRVNAHDETIKFLEQADWHQGVIHTFSGTAEQAREYLDMGLYLSFSGVVTFKNAGEILEVARTMPLEKMFIETDCPFLAPEPFRGKRNEPAYVKYVAQKIADVRGISFDEAAQATEENTRQLFRLS